MLIRKLGDPFYPCNGLALNENMIVVIRSHGLGFVETPFFMGVFMKLMNEGDGLSAIKEEET